MIALLLLLLMMMGTVSGQTVPDHCRSIMNPKEPVCSGGVDREGKLHYTVSFHPSAKRAQVDAFLVAIDMWNAYSDVTGIVLETTKDNGAHFQFLRGIKQSRDRDNRACAAYESNGSSIWYSEPLMKWANKSPRIAARVYAHELGHAMNLRHLNAEERASSVMRHREDIQVPCKQLATEVLSDVQADDARDVLTCAHGVRAKDVCLAERSH